MANTRMTFETGPLVMKFLVPFSTQPAPSAHRGRLLRRRVRAGLGLGQREAAELLARRELGQPALRAARRCPKVKIGSHTSEFCTDMITPVEAQAREISSSASA